MPWKITPYRPSVPMPYKWSTAISHLQVTRGLQKTVWRHRWMAVLIRPCSTLHKEGAWRKLFQVKYCEKYRAATHSTFFRIIINYDYNNKCDFYQAIWLLAWLLVLFLLLFRRRYLHLHLLKNCWQSVVFRSVEQWWYVDFIHIQILLFCESFL